MTEQQKARIVELARECERKLAASYKMRGLYAEYAHRTFATVASAEAFRIAQEARS